MSLKFVAKIELKDSIRRKQVWENTPNKHNELYERYEKAACKYCVVVEGDTIHLYQPIQ